MFSLHIIYIGFWSYTNDCKLIWWNMQLFLALKIVKTFFFFFFLGKKEHWTSCNFVLIIGCIFLHLATHFKLCTLLFCSFLDVLCMNCYIIQNSPVLKLYTWVVQYAHFVDCQDYLNTMFSWLWKCWGSSDFRFCGAK